MDDVLKKLALKNRVQEISAKWSVFLQFCMVCLIQSHFSLAVNVISYATPFSDSRDAQVLLNLSAVMFFTTSFKYFPFSASLQISVCRSRLILFL